MSVKARSILAALLMCTTEALAEPDGGASPPAQVEGLGVLKSVEFLRTNYEGDWAHVLVSADGKWRVEQFGRTGFAWTDNKKGALENDKVGPWFEKLAAILVRGEVLKARLNATRKPGQVVARLKIVGSKRTADLSWPDSEKIPKEPALLHEVVDHLKALRLPESGEILPGVCFGNCPH